MLSVGTEDAGEGIGTSKRAGRITGQATWGKRTAEKGRPRKEERRGREAKERRCWKEKETRTEDEAWWGRTQEKTPPEGTPDWSRHVSVSYVNYKAKDIDK